MARRYAIQIKEENYDLIHYLNKGIRPKIRDAEGERPYIFLFTADETTPGEIIREDDLYDENGHSIDPYIVWL